MSSRKTPFIFINYRRVMSTPQAVIIRDELKKHFGSDSVFVDFKSVSPGDYWEKKILTGLNDAQIMLSLIPANWVEEPHPNHANRRRIDLDDDWVKKEIKNYISKKKTIIPVLLKDGQFPKKKDLPNDLHYFTQYQTSTVEIRIESIEYDIKIIVDAIKKHLKSTSSIFQQQLSSPFPISNISTFFNKQIPQLRYGEISCNRNEKMRLMKQHFANNINSSSMHFFISGKREDKIDSLVERFVMEVLEKEYSIDYRVEDNNQEKILKVEPIPSYGNLDLDQKSFGSYFVKRFCHMLEEDSPEINSLDDFHNKDVPVHQKDYIVFVFKFTEENHHKKFHQFLKWIVSGFCSCSNHKTKCIFFYTFTQPKKPSGFWQLFKKDKTALVVDILKHIIQPNENCLYLSDFSWVASTDIQEWFEDYTTESLTVREYIERAKQDVRYLKYYDSKKDTFCMEAVEDLLRNIIKEKKQAF